ncbi:MAG: radical SAM protein [Deltaproteobacteria bacterium]|nr:radical SAM protein [Deltaproteobacteria bacterium]
MAASFSFDPTKYYRLPWSLTDNGISWLEVTTRCNLTCKGCYRDQSKEGHKSLKEIEEDLAVFKKERKSDCMSIAGGDPLVHPKIVEIVRMIKEGGWKPIVNTNGLALSKNLLQKLKEAGVFGFTFHVDTSQVRKDTNAKCEVELNNLRHKFAQMLGDVGGISCSFNQTVTGETLDQVSEVVRWSQQYPDIVHAVVFILFREPALMGNYDYYAQGKKINMNSTYSHTEFAGRRLLKSADVVNKIREQDPDFEPSAYLGGTVDPHSAKWLIGVRVGSRSKTYGYITPRFMELVQDGYHVMYNRWLSYSSPSFLRLGRSSALTFATFDKGMRSIARNYVRDCVKKPSTLLQPAYFQTFTIIQPIDLLSDGQANMCDGCPDMTVYKGKMYWSCRLEEIKEYGSFVSCVPRTNLKHIEPKATVRKQEQLPASP